MGIQFIRLLKFAKRKLYEPLEYLNTIFIQLIKSKIIFKNSSLTNLTEFPEIALKAAINKKTYLIFRRHRRVTPVLEHVSKSLGQKYLNIILNKYDLNQNDILEIIQPLQNIGSPKKYSYELFNQKISPTALRYLKIALDIKEQIKGKNNIKKFVEIGCGYGGQAVILSRILDIESYTFLDLWQVNLLIRRFIEDCNFTSEYKINTLGELENANDSYDFCLSNYAFSEIEKNLQQKYYKKVISKASNGYMIINSGELGLHDLGIQSFSQEKLLEMINNSYIEEEIPKCHRLNYVLKW